ncbi:hypothetical protein LOZ39_006721 [Ophidiomyces ophidiicola]|uniref:Uncharacterized protein n=1 Tax=Ophidiomyces ophidiicola TaxID=1387563 RepID=A0ACB8UM26_9EURO|nr:hypothetical protein LOZ61_006844 [Ophidiomyces ophidiicola]KAI1919026.1 hypothetical protein LOZ60_006870 [Ophidiomyces ophidiicola]KAI1998882.1 hypothetical protein LOZ50_006773 [Ophidiomyces ophidiicola]KAI1999858.1 hypothetical protein LOZ49_006806 [Ophidiomyces ophidiicola]KAI2006928.1 hypothetical protein LOZ46_006804 [Ophidiomyces ophidiicola]
MDELKILYRRKARELHPDRNYYGNVETSTVLFAEVQAAYDVLSDPQERAWYDSHLTIKKGERHQESKFYCGSNLTTTEDILAIMLTFVPTMEFSDLRSGFFGSGRALFNQLAEEEHISCARENLRCIEYPSFGSSADSFESIRSFYDIWSSFSTKKTFSWKDTHRNSDAPDRRTRRFIERENKRLRDEAIRDFNTAVRSLVRCIKKKDPRCSVHSLSETERQRSSRSAAATQASRSRAANEARLGDYAEPEWARRENLENDILGTDPDSEQEYFKCLLCHKTFKSEAQFNVHERSKKHVKAAKQLHYKCSE